MSAAIEAVHVLARTSEGQKSTSLGLAVILVLCVAAYFLFKSMSKHLKKVREEFPADTPGAQSFTPLSPQAAARQAAAREVAAPEPVTDTAAGDDSTSSSV